MPIDKDSAITQIFLQNKALPTPCQINNLNSFNYQFVGDNPYYFRAFKTLKHDSANGNSDFFSSSNWYTNLSYDNQIFKNSKIQNKIFIATKDSIKTSVYVNFQKLSIKQDNSTTTNLFIISLIVIFSLLAWTKTVFSKYYVQFFRSLFTYSESIKLFFDQNALIDRLYTILNLIFIFTGGIFLLQIGYLFNIEMPFQSILANLFCTMSIILLLYFFRFIGVKIIGWLLFQRNSFNEFLHSSFLYYKSLGILLLPIITITSFIRVEARSPFLITGCIIILLTYLANVFRGTKIMLKKDVLLFYWILYLCTVEFFPLILLYKYIRL
jgi:hypothetical protein